MAVDRLFGIHSDALALQHQRMDVLASNIANADTPNYLAKDIDFAKVLAKSNAGQPNAGATSMAQTNERHIAGTEPGGGPGRGDTVYRVPLQPSVDGNTVDAHVEQAAFADSAMHYQASLSFINGRLRSLMTAITGS